MFRIVLLAFWFIFIFARHVISMKVFSFNSTDDESDQFSSAVLVSSPKEALPEKFIACFSMKQDKIDNSSPFLIRDINKQPWIAPSVWNSGGLAFWFEIGKREWIKFHEFEAPWKFWSHICAELDTVTGNISVSVNGRETLTRSSQKLRDGTPGKLYQQLEIGVTETSLKYGGKRTFFGEVSNIHFHHVDGKNSPASLSKSPCGKKGSYLAWSEMTFTRSGENVFESEEKDEDVCDVLPHSYDVLLPGKRSWTSVNHLCKVLGSGTMTGVEDDQDLKNLADQVEGVSESCPALWLPLSDEKKEGVWENTNSNSPAKFLPWSDGQPNGLETQNHAIVDMTSFLLGDHHAEDAYCASCTLSSKTSLTLRGVCKDSYLGKLFKNFPTLPNLFTDTTYTYLALILLYTYL